MNSPELQAVVMAAGRGSRMTELCTSRPKALLPVGNQPLLMFPLLQLHNAGFKEAILVCLESQKTDFQTALDSLQIPINIDLVGIPANEDWGTADSLRFIKDRIKSDVFVISCDLISDLNLREFIDLFRKHEASLVACFLNELSNEMSQIVLPGPKVKPKPERDLVGIDASTSRLVFLASASDFEEQLSLPLSLLKKHQKMEIHSRLIDSHLYILRKWICDYLSNEKSFGTLKGELLPYIVKKQLFKPKRINTDVEQSLIGVDTKKDILASTDDSIIRINISNLSCHSLGRDPHELRDSIRCYAYRPPRQETNAFRANSLVSYCYANKIASSLILSTTHPAIHPGSTMQCTQFCNESRVGDRAVIEARTSLTRSHIGQGSQVQSKTRLQDCVVMANVIIEQGCSLINCILCDNCRIGSNTTLKNCLVGSNFNVPSDSNHQNEVLTDLDRLMEI